MCYDASILHEWVREYDYQYWLSTWQNLNHWRDESVGVYAHEGLFIGLNEVRNPILKVRKPAIPWDGIPDQRKPRKLAEHIQSSLSASWLQMRCDQLPPPSPRLPCHDGGYPWTRSQYGKLSLGCLSGDFISATQRVTNTEGQCYQTDTFSQSSFV